MRHVMANGEFVVPPLGNNQKILLLIGLLLLCVFIQILKTETDIRMLTALIVGGFVTAIVWDWQRRGRRLRWWRTALAGGVAAVVVLHGINTIGRLNPETAYDVTIGLGSEAAWIVAFLPAGALHIISRGTGWGSDST